LTEEAGPVAVPAEVLEGLKAVQESGETSMTDHRMVRLKAHRMGYHSTVFWIEENLEEYVRGLVNGFEPV
jgi:uncharacterized protein DUF5049